MKDQPGAPSRAPQTYPRRVFRRLIPRGESLVAAAGLVSAAIMLTTLGASAVWTMHTSQGTLRTSRLDQTRTIGSLLARSAESMISAGELSSLRTMITGVCSSYGLSRVTITAGDATKTVLADSGGGAGYAAVPAPWEDALLAPGNEQRELVVSGNPGNREIQVPIMIRGLGPAVLTVSDTLDYPLVSGWEGQVGAGVIGVVGLSVLWLGYRGARKRVRALGSVRESLQAIERGERSVAALIVAPGLGPEAVAWNRLLTEMDELRTRASAERAGQRAGAKRVEAGELTGVCDALWQGLVLVDDTMQVRYANGSAAVLLRAKREEMNGASLGSLLQSQKVLDATTQVVKGTSKNRVSIELERASMQPGGRPSVLRVTVRPLRKADAGAALMVIEDITQQRVADESRNGFVAAATHELRTPLTNILLYVDELLEDEQLDAKRRVGVNVIATEARRLERLVGDMLNVAEIEAGQFKLNTADIRLEAVFEELHADFAKQALERGMTLRFELPPKWPQVRGDRDKIVLALHNLIGNAIKYTPQGGSVSVNVNSDGQSLTVDVIDSGIGISEEERELIFDKFYRAKDKRISTITGTGLGLSIAREVTRLHGGDISVRSQIDKGSTFTLSLPLAA